MSRQIDRSEGTLWESLLYSGPNGYPKMSESEKLPVRKEKIMAK